MKILLSLFIAFLIYSIVQQEYYLFQWYKIDKCEGIDKLKVYDKLSLPLANNINFMHYYAQNLIDKNEFLKADSLLNLIAKRNPNKSFFIIWGDNKLMLHDTVAAINKFLIASWMIPNTIEPKFKIFDTYLTKKDSLNAKIWALKIVQQKIKIESIYTEIWQQKAQEFLK